MEKEKRIQGSLYGLVYGDVLGCPIETWKKWEIEKVFGHYNDLPASYPIATIEKEFPQKVRRLRPLGLHSDDGQQAMALLSICLSKKGWNLLDWKTLLVNGMDKGVWRGFGANFKEAVSKMKRGVRPELAGSSSAGIGAAMRIGVLGAIYHEDLETLRKVTLESTFMTHGDIRAGVYAYAVTFVIASFINGKDANTIKQELADEMYKAEQYVLEKYSKWSVDISQPHVVSEGIRELFSFSLTIQTARKKITSIAKPHLAEGFSKAHPNQGFVLTGGLHALYMSLQDELQPKEALLSIVREGYDTDTVAAIAGSMLGARYGTEWIPTHQFVDQERIVKYGQAMVSKETPEGYPTFLEKEKQWTTFEKRFRP